MVSLLRSPRRRRFQSAASLRRAASRVFLALLSALLVLAAAEGALRLAGFSYLFLRRGHAVPAADKFRVLCVGDSFTIGTGARPGESYPDHLGAMLGDGYAVFNEGRGGRTSFRLVEEIGYFLERYKPNAVVFLIGHNDRHWAEGIPGTEAWPPWLKEARLYKLAKRAWLVRWRDPGAPDDTARENAYRKEPGFLAGMADSLRWVQAGDLARAEERLRRMAADLPQNPVAHYALAECLYTRARAGRPDLLPEALREADLFIKALPGSRHGRRLREVILLEVGTLEKPDPLRRTLANHRRLLARAAAAGARPIVLSYPGFGWPPLRDLCREPDCVFVDIHARFAKELERREDPLEILSGDQVPVEESHPNGRGYALMAEEVRKAVLKVRARDGERPSE